MPALDQDAAARDIDHLHVVTRPDAGRHDAVHFSPIEATAVATLDATCGHAGFHFRSR
jgi:hypothetical protein